MGCGPSGVPGDIVKPTPQVDGGNTPAPAKQAADSGINIRAGDFEDFDVKILTLGAGECGKSTIWRQLKMLYCGGFKTEEERASMRQVIRINVISDMKELVGVLTRTGQNVAPDLAEIVSLVSDLQISEDELQPDVASQISDLWRDPAMKAIYQQANSIGLGDNTEYFLDSVCRIAAKNYIPTDEDILKSRIRTTGIAQLDFLINDKKTELVDVGGQKAERSRWQRCFQNVDFVLFVVSLSDFDQFMFEDETISRTKDSMDLFANIANSSMFAGKKIFLVLNKKDVFERKLSEYPEKFLNAYPGFEGDTSNVDACIEHVKKSFLNKLDANRSEEAWVKAIPACAMDQNNVKELFQQIAKAVVDA